MPYKYKYTWKGTTAHAVRAASETFRTRKYFFNRNKRQTDEQTNQISKKKHWNAKKKNSKNWRKKMNNKNIIV